MKGFTHKLTIYETPAVDDLAGGLTEGTEVEIVDLWGNVKQVRQRRVLENGALLTVTGVEITCRWLNEFDLYGGSESELQHSWRIGFNGQTFQIHEIENVDFNDRFAIIKAWAV